MLSGFVELFTLFFLVLSVQRLLIIGVASAFCSSETGKKNIIYRVDKVDWKLQSRREVLLSLRSHVVDCFIFSLVLATGLVKSSAEMDIRSLGISLVAAAAHFVYFEFGFYVLHRLMHHPRFFWMHRAHHQSIVAQPITMGSFSVSERVLLLFGFLAPFVIASSIFEITVPIHAPALALIVSDVFNVWGHMNVEWYPKSYINSTMRSVISSPTSHALHHARVHFNFGLNTPWFDRMFGTGCKDYGEAFLIAKSGRGFVRYLETAEQVRESLKEDSKVKVSGESQPGSGIISQALKKAS